MPLSNTLGSYYDQDKGPRPNNTNGTSTHINNFLFENFKGTINPNPSASQPLSLSKAALLTLFLIADGTCISNPCWNFVAGANGTQAIIFDLYNGTAAGLQATKVKVKPYKKQYSDTTVICDPATLVPGEQASLGFLCQRGPLVVTRITS